MTELDHTHDRAARSCIATANAAGFDFPIQDLPFAGFHRAGGPEDFRGGVAISEQIVDLDALSQSASPGSQAREAAGACRQAELNRFFAMGRLAWKALRHALFGLLHCDANAFSRQVLKTCLVPQSLAEHTVPARIGDYTDFYTSIYYATIIGRLFRPNDPLPTNLRWIPIASRGRASSVGVPGQQVTRPWGQVLPAAAALLGRRGARSQISRALALAKSTAKSPERYARRVYVQRVRTGVATAVSEGTQPCITHSSRSPRSANTRANMAHREAGLGRRKWSHGHAHEAGTHEDHLTGKPFSWPRLRF